MHLLKTINLETGEFYFTKYFGTRSSLKDVCDPEKKFKLKIADDGSKSVVTSLVNTYGTQSALNLAYEASVEANKKNARFLQKTTKTKVAPTVVKELVEDKKVEVMIDLDTIESENESSLPEEESVIDPDPGAGQEVEEIKVERKSRSPKK